MSKTNRPEMTDTLTGALRALVSLIDAGANETAIRLAILTVCHNCGKAYSRRAAWFRRYQAPLDVVAIRRAAVDTLAAL